MMEYKRFTKRIGDFVTNHCKPSCPYYNVCEDDDCHCDKAALEILAELEDKIEQGTLKKIPENAVVLTEKEYGELYQRMFDEVRQANDLKVEQASMETAEKFSEMAKELLDKQEKGWSANIIWIITAKNCIDETCKKITEGKI